MKTKKPTSKINQLMMLSYLMEHSCGASYTEKSDSPHRQYCIIEFVDETAKTATQASRLPRKLARLLNDVKLEARGISTTE